LFGEQRKREERRLQRGPHSKSLSSLNSEESGKKDTVHFFYPLFALFFSFCTIDVYPGQKLKSANVTEQ
jgi:hypothetical protein